MCEEDDKDVIAMEKCVNKGLYHVLHGSIPNGWYWAHINIPALVERLKTMRQRAYIAMNPNLEGESTAMYISRLVKPIGIKVTRLAKALSVGGDLEYADEVTLSKSNAGRTEM